MSPILSSGATAQLRFLKILLKYYEGPATQDTLDFINAIIDDWGLLAAERSRCQNQTEATRELWPGWELKQMSPASRKIGPVEWWKRWNAAGVRCGWKGASRSRFIALKNSPIWGLIGKGAGGYRDTYGFAHPPFVVGDCSSFWDATPEDCRDAGIQIRRAHLNSAGMTDIRAAINKFGMPRLEDLLGH